ncbi:MAG: hypothetical protein ACLSVD_01780 [Eggerthellaceae bacterium]
MRSPPGPPCYAVPRAEIMERAACTGENAISRNLILCDKSRL